MTSAQLAPRAARRARGAGTLVGTALGLVLAVAPLGLVPVQASTPVRVAIIVGPTGAEVTPWYIGQAEEVAGIARGLGASVQTAYSPQATPKAVVAAVAGANVIVYFGHGNGFPNPYSNKLHPQKVNGWGLQGPNAVGTHADSWADGTLRYYGEEWIRENAHPAPGFVMIYSNTCYAAGAPELRLAPATEDEARQRVANYSRPMLALGAAGFFASDFNASVARLVESLLSSPSTPLSDLFEADAQFDAGALSVSAHPDYADHEVWLHRSPDHNGRLDYWYAFAGDPDASLAGGATGLANAAQPIAAPGTQSHGTTAPAVVSLQPAVVSPQVAAWRGGETLTGVASQYGQTWGFEGQPTVALPQALGGSYPPEPNTFVEVCSDRCAVLRVVDSCTCYFGTTEERIVNLSLAAWSMISDAPIEEGVIRVTMRPASAPRAVPRQVEPLSDGAPTLDPRQEVQGERWHRQWTDRQAQ